MGQLSNIMIAIITNNNYSLPPYRPLEPVCQECIGESPEHWRYLFPSLLANDDRHPSSSSLSQIL